MTGTLLSDTKVATTLAFRLKNASSLNISPRSNDSSLDNEKIHVVSIPTYDTQNGSAKSMFCYTPSTSSVAETIVD